ncbi:hypothetical protein [Arthrobacter sp. H14]|uniref:hypothetical protein n=1 Tax=Arthrobacter sp. H14 TaxID=1312959 RepID=UPI0012DDD689|nr:hypothetical protein [Arthrobacter sp. H14]
MSIQTIARQPRGTRVGGQFAATQHSESLITLKAAPAPECTGYCAECGQDALDGMLCGVCADSACPDCNCPKNLYDRWCGDCTVSATADGCSYGYGYPAE